MIGCATVIGIDCAADPRNVGLARGEVRGDEAVVFEVRTIGKGAREREESEYMIIETVAGWCAKGKRTLLALDAPLGWPAAMGAALIGHHAGEGLTEEANDMFRRVTDGSVFKRIKHRPLDVGAERIARTAHAALTLLQKLRERTSELIPLAWQPGFSERLAAIEVYPAGTLASYDLIASGYKRPEQIETRRTIIDGLRQHMALPADERPLLDRADTLDAAVCILAARDFLVGDVIAPDDLHRARKEGWIWVRPPVVGG